MIIKSMEQLGKCIDDEVELEFYFIGVNSDWLKWDTTIHLADSMSVLQDMVIEGRFRTRMLDRE